MSSDLVGENTERFDHDAPNVRRPAIPVKAVLGASVAAVAIAVSWLVYSAKPAQPGSVTSLASRRPIVSQPFPVGGRFEGDPYIGHHVCAECHPAEAALHSRSGHALTLWPPGRRAIARRLDGTTIADPEFPGAFWDYRVRDGQLYIARRTSEKVEECIADYAFGSGHYATTFVSMIDARIPAILEHRITLFTQDGALALTPGHEVRPAPPGVTPNGGLPPPRASRNCFGCHSTQLSAHDDKRIDERTMIPNVSCERRHGPARAHVTAARLAAPRSQLSLPFGPDRWTAAELMRFCGECHRHPSGPRPDEIRRGDPTLARFQPIGLMLSKCYRLSDGALSCITCHDPHARPSRNRPEYDSICLSCHGGIDRSSEQPPGKQTHVPECSISPRDRCVECHMPRVAVDPGQHVRLSDHWIRIHAKTEATMPN